MITGWQDYWKGMSWRTFWHCKQCEVFWLKGYADTCWLCDGTPSVVVDGFVYTSPSQGGPPIT